MSHSNNDPADHDHGVGHVVPLKILFATGTALLFLTFVTVWIAGFDFGAANIGIAMAVACLKASLVVLFFMHLRWDRPFNSFIFVGSIFFVGIFIAFALADSIAYRGDVIAGDGIDVQTKLAEVAAAE
ncbi:MAG: cytochrome C oxidase subunit IV family protein [Planctomycetota bacterium]|jgi:cytochrome c oxidase subunit 4